LNFSKFSFFTKVSKNYYLIKYVSILSLFNLHKIE